MAKPYSDDLRARAIAIVEGGASRHEVAALLAVGARLRYLPQYVHRFRSPLHTVCETGLPRKSPEFRSEGPQSLSATAGSR